MSPGEIRAQLDRILSSPQFSQAGRLSRFLRHVVDAAQSGQADSVKEYPIGVEVFERGADFDPRIDPIVRVQAAKLRSKLTEYYASPSAAHDPIVIGMPKGSYVPEIRERQPAASAASPPAPDRSRIAVLPFVNMSADPENEYFSDGLTEELINRLACVPGLQVVARTSAFRFKGQYEDLREVGAKLNVGTVMEGSVRKAGDQLRITAQLIDVQSGYHLFSQTYQRELKNVFELQDELAQAVVDEIAPLSAPESGRTISKTRAVDLDAYNAYLRGVYAQSNHFTDRRQWIDSFHEALRIDPNYAPAWAGLAHGYFLLTWFYQMPAREGMPLAKEAALKTLELDANLAEGHSSLGLVSCSYEWNWASADASFRRAIGLQPSLAVPYSTFAVCCLLPQLRLEEACSMAERSMSLDPFNPLSRATAAFIHANAGHFQEALRHLAFGLEFNPKFGPFHYTSAVVHEWEGDLDNAVDFYQKAYDLGGGLPAPLSSLGHAFALSGKKAEARRILERLMKIPEPPAVDIATVHLGLRDTEEALRWLETAVEQRNIRLLTIRADRRFQWLSSHPRFREILKRMGLQTAGTAA